VARRPRPLRPLRRSFSFRRLLDRRRYYAPVARTFVTYAVTLSDDAARYVETMGALPAMKAWLADVEKENGFLIEDEPYRLAP
jgi:hypothetical protein